jgi:hypothetical protein
MKVISIPSSGKISNLVSYKSRFGQCHRAYCIPANTQSPARQKMRGAFGGFAPAWGRVLTQAQREAWDVAGAKVQSKKRLGSGPLTGQQLFQGLNSARACIGRRGLLVLPPEPVVFGPNPVGQLIIANGANGARLLLSVTGPVTEDIMVFGQAPCSAGRMKRRNVAYLGLPPAPQDGLIDITDLYVARYGEPRPGEKVFIVTVQQQDGWEGDEKETSEIVPDKPADQQATATPALTLLVHMHKGCTRDAQETGTTPVPGLQESGKPGMPVGDAPVAELGGVEGDCKGPMADSQVRPKAASGPG